MAKRLLISVAILLVVAACSEPPKGGPSPIPNESTVSGQVTTAGVPVPGARVRTVAFSGATVTAVYTDADGRYSLPGVGRNVLMEAWTPGYYPAVALVTGPDPFGRNFVLDPGQPMSVGDTFRGYLQQNAVGSACDFACTIYRLIPAAPASVDITLSAPACGNIQGFLLTRSVDVTIPRISTGLFTIRTSLVAGETYELRVESSTNCADFEISVLPAPAASVPTR